MTVYHKMKTISKKEFINFIRALYWKAHTDGIDMVDDEMWLEYRMPDEDFDTIVADLWNDAERLMKK